MIRQTLTLEGVYPDGEWSCAGCGGRITTGEDHRAALEHDDDCPGLAAIRKQGAAAERARIRQLAAGYQCGCGGGCEGTDTLREFADLIGGDQS